MPAAARPAPQAAPPRRTIFPKRPPGTTAYSLYLYHHKHKLASAPQGKNLHFSQLAAIANQRLMATNSSCEQARNATHHSRVAFVHNVENRISNYEKTIINLSFAQRSARSLAD